MSSPTAKRIPLTHWIHRTIGLSQARIQLRLRGNHLYILCEADPCPEMIEVTRSLQRALSQTPLHQLLPPDTPPIYQITVYGRTRGQRPACWGKTLSLQPTAPPVAQPAPAPLTEPASLSGAAAPDPKPATQSGNVEAIAHHLSQALSQYGISVRIKRVALGQGTVSDTPPLQRLMVLCESAYSPDANLLAEPLAQGLRELNLVGFHDAIVFGQVRGESRAEWTLRIDLTPARDILQQWGRWGDVQAIARWLNQALQAHNIRIAARLKSPTLHLSCVSRAANGTIAAADKLTVLGTVTPILQALRPQGIHAVTLYGVSHQAVLDQPDVLPEAAPVWVHWLDLADAAAADRAPTTLELAQVGNLEAIAFLLTRLLNPNLDHKLATGGIRVQVHQREDLLHIMAEAANCPRQDQIGTTVVRFLKPLQIAGITGVRVYGRRSGQKQPLWSHGSDFNPRVRLVPEATPEFAASEAYVQDLLEPAGALVTWEEPQAEDRWSVVQEWWETLTQGVQRSLIATQLFVPREATSVPIAAVGEGAPSQPEPAVQWRSVALAAVWTAVGALLTVQSDWLLGQWVQTPIAEQPASSTNPVPQDIPQMSLQKSQPAHWQKFGQVNGFTQSGQGLVSAQEPRPTGAGQSLSASPLQVLGQPSAALTHYPTFNSQQLDHQIGLYRSYVEANGVPDILVIGSSRALRGVDPTALKTALAQQGYTDVKVFNFGINGATAQVADLLVRQIVPQERLPKLIIWADGARAFNSGRVDITYNGIVASQGYRTLASGKLPIPGTIASQPATPTRQTTPADAVASSGGAYDAFNETLNAQLGAWSQTYTQRDRLKELLRDQVAQLFPKGTSVIPAIGVLSAEKLVNVSSPAASASTTAPSLFSEGQGMLDVNGYLPLSVQFNPATYYQKYARVPGDYDSDYELFRLEGSQIEALTALSQFTQARKIPLVFVNLPMTKEYLDAPRRRYEEQFQQQMLKLAPQLGFIYRDLSQALIDKSDYFSDPSHLNRYGGYEISRRLVQDVMIPWYLVR